MEAEHREGEVSLSPLGPGRGCGFHLCLLAVVVGFFILFAYRGSRRTEGRYAAKTVPFSLTARPGGDGQLYDYGKCLSNHHEYTGRWLRGMRRQYRIDAVLLTLPRMPPGETLETCATKVVTNWSIGKTVGGRGLLLLLDAHRKEVKVEVGYALEGVLTDAFTGYAETKQLRPHFLSGTLGEGLVAVLEEIEARAALKERGSAQAKAVGILDRRFLSGGAGAVRRLRGFRKDPVRRAAPGEYPAGKTPAEAWQTMLAAWKRGTDDSRLGVYTHLARIAYRDYEGTDSRRLDDSYRTRAKQKMRIRRDGDYAAVWSGKKRGWHNTPLLFCRTPEGWQFDLVHQRRLITMGRSPYWGVQRGNSPYDRVLARCSYWLNKDVPLADEDRYTPAKDAAMARRYLELEAAFAKNDADFETALGLARIAALTSMRPKYTYRYLRRAKALNPKHPDPHKYAAVYVVHAQFLYGKAAKELRQCIAKGGDGPHIRAFLGYALLEAKDVDGAIQALQEAVKKRPDFCYAYCKLARAWLAKRNGANSLNPLRLTYDGRIRYTWRKARAVKTPDPLRLKWLAATLRKNGLR